MTEKLVKCSVPGERSPTWRPSTLAAPDAPREVRLAGSMIGIALVAMLVISFVLALAGHAGKVAIGDRHSGMPSRMATFVL